MGLTVLPFSGAALDRVDVQIVNSSSENEKDSLDDALTAASLSTQALDEGLTNTQDLLGTAQAEYGRMLSALYERGYYGPDISVLVDGQEAESIDPFSPPANIKQIRIVVDPGPRFKFGEAQVAPRAPNATANPIVDGFQRGKTAESGLIVSAARAGVNEWREEGHAKADVAGQTLIADHPKRQLDASVSLSPGPKLSFGTVKITPGSEVSNKRLREIMGFPTGQVYSPEALRIAGNRLRRAGAFSTVTLAEDDVPNPDGTLDYTLTILDDKKRRIGARFEYSTLDGFTLGGFWLHRNVFGGAERFRIDGLAEGIGVLDSTLNDLQRGQGITYRVNARLTRPGTFGPDNSVFANVLAERPDEDDYTETSISAVAGISRYFNDKLYGEFALGPRYSESESVFGDRTFTHIVFPSRLEWDGRDDPGDPTKGLFFNADVQPYIGLGGSESGGRLFLDTRSYLGFGKEKRLVLAGRVQYGSIVGSAIDETPPSFLFYSGGGGTVRGQAYQSLGVENEGLGTSGGRSFLGLSGEIRTKVTKTIGLVAFYDYGFVGPNSTVSSGGGYQSGTGLGVRYATPIGPIRVDLATPVLGEQRDAFDSVELYIGVGQAF